MVPKAMAPRPAGACVLAVGGPLEYENMDPFLVYLGQQARGLLDIISPLLAYDIQAAVPRMFIAIHHEFYCPPFPPSTKLTSWGKFAAQAHLAWPLKLFTRTVANQGAAGRRGRPEILGSIHHAYVRHTKLLRVRGEDMFASQLPKSRC